MEQERRCLDVLGAVATYALDAGQLQLATTDGRALAFIART
jgi:heat shock protein HslJ